MSVSLLYPNLLKMGASSGNQAPVASTASAGIAGTAPAPQPTVGAMPWLARPDRRPEVKILQQYLKSHGFDCGPIDGYLGPVTEGAVRRFQQASGLVVDGQVGPQTWGAMGYSGAPRASSPKVASQLQLPATPSTTPQPPADAAALRQRLLSNINQPALNWKNGCLAYASQIIMASGGHNMRGQTRLQVPSTTAGRGQKLAYLATLEQQGILKVGDVVYANKNPGTDPASNNLANGPHWFIYLGNGQILDRRGVTSIAATQAWLPGRVIDAIFHPFDVPPA